MGMEVEMLALVTELVCCRRLKSEETRLRQRRECSIKKDPVALAKADAMRDEYAFRAPQAWLAAELLVNSVVLMEEPGSHRPPAHRVEELISRLLDHRPREDDPCPSCAKGQVCRTPACGRLQLKEK